jgi:hypothetical protein
MNSQALAAIFSRLPAPASPSHSVLDPSASSTGASRGRTSSGPEASRTSAPVGRLPRAEHGTVDQHQVQLPRRGDRPVGALDVDGGGLQPHRAGSRRGLAHHVEDGLGVQHHGEDDVGPRHHVFAGSIGTTVFAAVALPGILITAALFLRAVQRLLTGPVEGRSEGFADLTAREALPVGGLLALALAVGVVPRPLLDLITPGSATVVDLVSR